MVDGVDEIKLSYTDLLKLFRESGEQLNIAHNNVPGIIMPTVQFLKDLERRRIYNTFEKLQDAVRPGRENYDCLFNDTDNFLANNPGFEAEQILDIMDSHIRTVLL
jgi:hypothetical protein